MCKTKTKRRHLRPEDLRAERDVMVDLTVTTQTAFRPIYGTITQYQGCAVRLYPLSFSEIGFTGQPSAGVSKHNTKLWDPFLPM